ncbi:hypothetical protein [Paenibacillus kyungheensis]
MLGFIGGLFSIAFLVFLVLAIISSQKKDGKAKKRWIIAATLFFISGILSQGNSAEVKTAVSEKAEVAEAAPVTKVEKTTTDTNQKVDKENTKVADSNLTTKTIKVDEETVKKNQKKEQQKLVLNFEKKFYSIEDSGKSVIDDYTQTMESLGKGNTDIYTAYSATVEAQKMADSLASQYYNLDVPDQLPKNVKDYLSESKMGMFYSYSSKSDGLDIMLDFLDEQKPSLVQEIKEKTTQSDQETLSAVMNMLQAKEAIGLDISKK